MISRVASSINADITSSDKGSLETDSFEMSFLKISSSTFFGFRVEFGELSTEI
jgi:hypothetical protein